MKKFIKNLVFYIEGKNQSFSMEILKIFSMKKIIKIINLFIESPEKNYFLTDVAKPRQVNITTTFRILNKLAEKGFLKTKIVER